MRRPRPALGRSATGEYFVLSKSERGRGVNVGTTNNCQHRLSLRCVTNAHKKKWHVSTVTDYHDANKKEFRNRRERRASTKSQVPRIVKLQKQWRTSPTLDTIKVRNRRVTLSSLPDYSASAKWRRKYKHSKFPEESKFKMTVKLLHKHTAFRGEKSFHFKSIRLNNQKMYKHFTICLY